MIRKLKKRAKHNWKIKKNIYVVGYVRYNEKEPWNTWIEWMPRLTVNTPS